MIRYFIVKAYFCFQGEGEWFWGVDEVQEADERAEIWFKPDSEPTLHTVVVTDDQ